MWEQRYSPPRADQWTGRDDGGANERIHEIVRIVDLRDGIGSATSAGTGRFCIIGFACDEGVRRNLGRPGARFGPGAIRSALANLANHLGDDTMLCDVGDIVCHDGDLEASQQTLGVVVATLLEADVFPIVIGGGHEAAWGHYQGLERAGRADDLAIVNFDAHFDLRPLLPGAQGSSGTPFRQMALAAANAGREFDYTCLGIQKFANTGGLFDAAAEFGCRYGFAGEFDCHPKSDVARRSADDNAPVDPHDNRIERMVDDLVESTRPIYMTVCLDVFSQAHAPGVSAPQPLGLDPSQILPLMRTIASSGKLTSLEVVELSPPLDESNKTARLAATIVADCIHTIGAVDR